MKNKKEIDIKDIYVTRDPYVSAAISLQQKLLRIEPKDNYFVFIFEKYPAEEISQKYWNGTLHGNIHDYVCSIKRTKDCLFAKKRGV